MLVQGEPGFNRAMDWRREVYFPCAEVPYGTEEKLMREKGAGGRGLCREEEGKVGMSTKATEASISGN